MVVSLEKTGVKSWATYPGGQSGNPGSKHYADMLERWTSGKYFPMVFMKDPEAAKDRTLQSVQFNPQQK
jgi:penicillin amidase